MVLVLVSYISSLYELAQMVESSSTVGVNKAQLVATHDGKVILGTVLRQGSKHQKDPPFQIF